jgi:hypothetical protein
MTDSVLDSKPSFPDASAVSTPGREFPGAYPRTPSDFPTSTNTNVRSPTEIVQSSKDAITAASASASSFAGSLPGADTVGAGVDGVKEALFNASVSAAQYLPHKVVEYFPGGTAIVAASSAENTMKDAQGIHISLPSEEHEPSVSSKGVGSLPGPVEEEGVAKLPLEKSLETKSQSNIRTDDQASSDANQMAPTVEKTTSGSMLQENLDEIVPPTSSPTHPSKDGATVEPTPINLTPTTHPLAGEGAEWKGVPLDENYQRVLDKVFDVEWEGAPLDDKRQREVDKAFDNSKIDSTAQSSSAINTAKNLPPTPLQNDSTAANVGHHELSTPSLMNSDTTASTTLSSPKTHAKNESVSSTTSDSGPDSPNGTGSRISSTPRKKTNLLSKIRGEAKVISGKLGGKEEKVEEGRKIMRGEI